MEPIPERETIAWALIAPSGPVACSVRRTRREVIDDVLGGLEQWHEMRAMGWKLAKVRVIPMEAESNGREG